MSSLGELAELGISSGRSQGERGKAETRLVLCHASWACFAHYAGLKYYYHFHFHYNYYYNCKYILLRRQYLLHKSLGREPG